MRRVQRLLVGGDEGGGRVIESVPKRGIVRVVMRSHELRSLYFLLAEDHIKGTRRDVPPRTARS